MLLADSERRSGVALGGEEIPGGPGDGCRQVGGRPPAVADSDLVRPGRGEPSERDVEAGGHGDGLGQSDPAVGGLDLSHGLAGPADPPQEHLVGEALLGQVGLGSQGSDVASHDVLDPDIRLAAHARILSVVLAVFQGIL